MNYTGRSRLLGGAAIVAALVVMGLGSQGVWSTIPLVMSHRPRDGALAVELAGSAQPFHHECGLVSPGEDVGFSLPIVNDSDRPLRILRSDVSCGCLQLRDVPSMVPARGRADIASRLNITSQTGFVSQRAAVATDDPNRPWLEYRVTAAVRGPRVEPKSLHLGQVPVGRGSRRLMTAALIGYPQAKFIRVECDNPLIRVAFAGEAFARGSGTRLESYGPEMCREVEVFISDDAPAGEIHATATIGLETPEAQIVQCKVTADVAGLVRCIPGQIIYSNTEPDREYAQKILLVAASDREIDLGKLEVHCYPPLFSATFDKSSAKRGSIAVALTTRSMAPEMVRGTVVGLIGEEEVFKIPILAIPRPAVAEGR